jgi:hypothetical protein
MKLFFVMSLVDAALCLLVFEAGNVCKWRLYEVFSWTIMFTSDIEQQYRALWVL